MREQVGVDVLGYVEVHFGGLEVLPDGEDVAAVCGQVVHDLVHFFGFFAEADHDAAFAAFAVFLDAAYLFEAALVFGLGPYLAVQTGHGFHVVRHHFLARRDHPFEGVPVAFYVGDQRFDGGLRTAFLYRATGAGTWLRLSQTQSYTSWSGFAFEAVCQKHQYAIKQALGIAGVYTEVSAWRYTPKKGETGAQIDLLLDRADHTINLCEMKFARDEFVIDKKYAGELDNKIKVFKEQTKTRKTIFPTLITTYGTKQNIYYTGRVVSELTMEDLFK